MNQLQGDFRYNTGRVTFSLPGPAKRLGIGRQDQSMNMIRKGIVGVAFVVSALAAIGASPVAAAGPADTTADAVLGQPNLTSNTLNEPSGDPTMPTASNLALSNAAHLAIAPDGRLYISDADNHRVLSWPDAAAFADGDAADMAFGQPDFVSNVPNNGGVSASTLSLPQGLSVDEAGNLWVADAFNSRVLKFNDPATDATPTAADLVIGQPDMVSNDGNLGGGPVEPDVALPDSLLFPGRVIVRGDDVFIADSGNSRVLHYAAPMANKPLADLVFGQFGDFTIRAKNNQGDGVDGCCPLPENLFNPIGLALDAGGSLFVADWMNHRVLRYDDPLATDVAADAVIGQPDLFSNAPNNGGVADGLSLPIDLFIGCGGALYVADSANNRVLVHDDPIADASPDRVFGQLGSFAANGVNHGLGFFATDPDALWGPTAARLDADGRLHVVDTNNHRLLRFDAAPLVPGDMNDDGVFDVDDVAAFALALTDPIAYASVDCGASRGDLDGSGDVDGLDVAPFVAALVAP